MKNWYRLGVGYATFAVTNGIITGNRYWYNQDHSKLYVNGEDRLVSREYMDRAVTIMTTCALNLSPPVFFYSMCRNVERLEVWWRGLDPNKFRFFYERV